MNEIVIARAVVGAGGLRHLVNDGLIVLFFFIGVIAIFYTDRVNLWWLTTAAAGLLIAAAMRKLGVNSPWSHVPVGVLVWFATLESGVHATLAGVALGLLTPARLVAGRDILGDLERSLHPVSAFLVIPIFALANAGVDLRGGMTYLGRRLRWGTLPADMHHREILGAAALGGIGFTVSLFITDLAFTDTTLIGQAKVGILAASAVAALIGAILLLTAPTATASDNRRR